MQRIGILTAFVIWICLAGKLIVDNNCRTMEPTEVFANQDFVRMEGDVRGFGEVGVTYFSKEEKEMLIKSIASSMGIEPEYSLSDVITEKSSEIILTKKAKSADINIRLISVSENKGFYIEETHYVEIFLNLNENIHCASTYRDLIEEIFEAEDIQGNVTINLRGMIEGTLNYSRKNEIANALLNQMDATIVSENRGSELFTIYAYSPQIEEEIITAGKKININISEGYDEQKNMTTIYFSTPLNNLDY